MAHQMDDLARGLAAGTISRRTAIWRVLVGAAAAAVASVLPATQAAAAPKKVDLNGTTINGCFLNGVCVNGTDVKDVAKEIKEQSKDLQKELKEAGQKDAAKALKEETKDVIKTIKQGDGGVIPPS